MANSLFPRPGRTGRQPVQPTPSGRRRAAEPQSGTSHSLLPGLSSVHVRSPVWFAVWPAPGRSQPGPGPRSGPRLAHPNPVPAPGLAHSDPALALADGFL